MLLINALAATNLSSRNVIRGWIQGLNSLDEDSVRVTVLAPPGVLQGEPWGCRIRIIYGPPVTRHWIGRRIWESAQLRKVAREHQASAVMHFSGIAVPELRIPQFTFYHNPFPFLVGSKESPVTGVRKLKAALQLAAMRQAVQIIQGAVVPSRYMRDLILQRMPGIDAVPVIIAPHGLTQPPEDIDSWPRKEGQIVMVSNWAPHKNVETVLESVSQMNPGDVSLEIIGPWASAAYRRRIELLIHRLGLSDQVDITGYLSRDEMKRRVLNARIFCLLSRSESFGLPALEAQALGTPVIVAAGTAMPEVCGDAAIAVPAGDATTLTREIRDLLNDEQRWHRLSNSGMKNARRYSWKETAGRMRQVLESSTQTTQAETQGSQIPPGMV